MTLWWQCFVVVFAIALAGARWHGSRYALGLTTILAILVPSWWSYVLFGHPIHFKIGVTFIGLAIYVLDPRSVYNLRFSAVDCGMLGIVIVHAASDTYHNGTELETFLRLYAEWLVPYFGGRLCVQEIADAKKLMPTVAIVAIIVASSTIFEAISGFNWWDSIAGPPPETHLKRLMIRWDLTRPHASTMHPMYVGQLLLLLLPWCMALIFCASRVTGVACGMISFATTIIGIGFSTSRSAIIGVAIFALTYFIAWPTQARKWVIGFALVSSMGLAVISDDVVTALHYWSSETDYRKLEETAVTGTMARINLFSVYAPAIEKAGMLGFGTVATAPFPPMIPRAVTDPRLFYNTQFVDNTYLLHYLRFGICGLVCFIWMLCASLWALYCVGNRESAVNSVICRGLLSSMVAVTFGMLTVWFPPDYGFLVLWTVGISSGLQLGLGQKSIDRLFLRKSRTELI